MSIQKYKPGMALAVGQWVCFEGLLTGSFANRPGIIRKLTKGMVACEVPYRSRHSDEIDWEPKSKRLSSITFVADTEEEANVMMKASSAFIELAMRRENDLKKELAIERQRFITQALESQNSNIVETPDAKQKPKI